MPTKKEEEKKPDDRPFECRHCGDCCIWTHIPVHPVYAANPHLLEWLAARGIGSINANAMIDGHPTIVTFVTFRLPCPNLVNLPDLKTACAIQDRKPAACQRYRCDRDPIMLAIKTRKNILRGHSHGDSDPASLIS